MSCFQLLFLALLCSTANAKKMSSLLLPKSTNRDRNSSRIDMPGSTRTEASSQTGATKGYEGYSTSGPVQVASTMIVCQNICEFCFDEKGEAIRCFINEGGSALSVLRAVEETSGYLKVVSRINLGTTLFSAPANVNLTKISASIPCFPPSDLLQSDKDEQFCVRRIPVNAKPPKMPPPLFETLPRGAFEAMGFRQIPRLSSADGLEVAQQNGVLVFARKSADVVSEGPVLQMRVELSDGFGCGGMIQS